MGLLVLSHVSSLFTLEFFRALPSVMSAFVVVLSSSSFNSHYLMCTTRSAYYLRFCDYTLEEQVFQSVDGEYTTEHYNLDHSEIATTLVAGNAHPGITTVKWSDTNF